MLDLGMVSAQEHKEMPKLKALYLTEPVGKLPEGIETLIIQGVYKTELLDKAEVVFPATTFAETSGTVTSFERRVQKLERSSAPPRMALEDWDILCRLGAALGGTGFDFKTSGDITGEALKAAGKKLGPNTIEGQPKFISDVEKLQSGMLLPGFRPGAYRGLPMRDVVEDLDRVLTKWGVSR
jgi:NADH dehydrogenase/NADH:ubiquinone oxidoreductase subunit G